MVLKKVAPSRLAIFLITPVRSTGKRMDVMVASYVGNEGRGRSVPDGGRGGRHLHHRAGPHHRPVAGGRGRGVRPVVGLRPEAEADLLEETASPDTGSFFRTGLFLDGSSPSCRAPLPIGRLSGVAIPQKILRFDQELELTTF